MSSNPCGCDPDIGYECEGCQIGFLKESLKRSEERVKKLEQLLEDWALEARERRERED